MRICIFYNGTDSSFEKDVNLEFSSNRNRFMAGEIISRLAHTVDCNESHVLQVNGVSDDSRFLGTALGVGLEQNVQFGKNFWVHRMSQSVDADNELIICGWSRGGITAMCLARAVSDYLNDKQVAINSWKIKVMAFDPVAGKGANWEGQRQWYQLDPRVTEYVGFYARHETTQGFETTIPSRASFDTKMTLIDVAAFHSSLVGSVTETPPKIPGMLTDYDRTAARVYRIVQMRAIKTLNDKDEWCIPFDKSRLKAWKDKINGLPAAIGLNSTEEISELRDRCRTHAIAFDKVRTTDYSGRGVFVGNNLLSRKWDKDIDIWRFLDQDNSFFTKGRILSQIATEAFINRGSSVGNFSCEMIDGGTETSQILT